MLHDQIAHIATLARLDPDPAQLERFASQCSDILGYVDLLAEVDTEGVAPLYSPIDDPAGSAVPPLAEGNPLASRPNVFRPDVSRPSPSRADVLANAPETDGSFFIVPRIV